MKTQPIVLLSTFILFWSSCSQTNSQQATTSLPNNTPKGQASVVDTTSAKNILQVAIQSPDHTTLVAAVQAAGIEHILVNAGPLTVFAPINEAFESLPPGTVDDLLKPENKPQLANILSGHAAPGSFDLEALKKEFRKGRKIYTATGKYLNVTVKQGNVFISGSKILATIPTSNGVINVVDQVILEN
ncbi:MAG: fasciclin domain-containing protein [Cyclobacteriaceae bacterium]